MKYFLLPGIWAGFIAIVSLVSVSNLPEVGINYFDKMAHVFVYFILTITLLWAVLKKNKRNFISLTTLFMVFASSIMYGILIEILQFSITTGRNFEIPDIIANIVGCIFGVLLYKPIKTSVHEF